MFNQMQSYTRILKGRTFPRKSRPILQKLWKSRTFDMNAKNEYFPSNM